MKLLKFIKMNKLKINKNCLYIVILTVATFIAYICMYGKFGDVIIDCGREAFFPQQINQGCVLYKDILNLYGPFSYMFNAVLYKLFGTNLNTLYMAGMFGGFAITMSVYILARNFLDEHAGFVLGILAIITGIFSSNLFNFIFPYSYGMLYGTAFCLLSLIFLFEKTKNSSLIAAVFAGIAVSCKYEFLLFAPVFLISLHVLYKPNLKQFLMNLAAFFLCPFLCFGILFLNGLTFEDITRSIKIIKYLSNTTTLHYFYSNQGIIYRNEHFIVWGKQLLNCCVAFFLLISGFNAKRKIVQFILFVFSVLYLKFVMNCFIFSFIPLLIFIFFAFSLKRLSTEAKIFIISIFSISAKTFLCLSYLGYGIFYFAPVILCFLLLLPKKNLKEYSVFLLIVSFIILFTHCKANDKTYKIDTPKGLIYTTNTIGKGFEQTIDYIKTKTKKTDRIVVYPEGQLLNFLTDREGDNFIYSLIPLYIETFSEKNIVHRLSVTKPEYIIINNWDTSDYKYKELCGDYGFKIADYIKKNYKKDAVLGQALIFTVYKRKSL